MEPELYQAFQERVRGGTQVNTCQEDYIGSHNSIITGASLCYWPCRDHSTFLREGWGFQASTQWQGQGFRGGWEAGGAGRGRLLL